VLVGGTHEWREDAVGGDGSRAERPRIGAEQRHVDRGNGGKHTEHGERGMA